MRALGAQAVADRVGAIKRCRGSRAKLRSDGRVEYLSAKPPVPWTCVNHVLTADQSQVCRLQLEGVTLLKLPSSHSREADFQWCMIGASCYAGFVISKAWPIMGQAVSCYKEAMLSTNSEASFVLCIRRPVGWFIFFEC